MSKLYDTYISLKANEKNIENTLYLFKSGIFFICIDEDAKKASEILNLKLTNLNQDIVKCGFPIKSLEKYSNILKLASYSFKIIDTSKSEILSVNDYSLNTDITSLLQYILKIDVNNLSIKEAYEFIDEIQKQTKIITEGVSKNV